MPATIALPPRGGIGLKLGHCRELLDRRPDLGFVEVHAENHLSAGGPARTLLEAVRAILPLSLHGVGLSIGGSAPLDPAHLARLAEACRRYAPASFSEHLAWSSHGPVYLNDLLPVAYDRRTLARVCDHVDELQEVLQRRILLENPSTYVGLEASRMDEVDFLSEIVGRTGCGLLLDVTNVLVSATNHGTAAEDYLARFPLGPVGEIHLAGFAPERDGRGDPLLIDAHDRAVDDRVWSLYASVVARTGPLPTLIEWDNEVPPLARLVAEAHRAEAVMRTARPGPAAEAA